MVNRLDAKNFVKQYHDKYFGGNQIQVREIRPPKEIKYYPVEQYMWKKAMPEQAERVIFEVAEIRSHLTKMFSLPIRTSNFEPFCPPPAPSKPSAATWTRWLSTAPFSLKSTPVPTAPSSP